MKPRSGRSQNQDNTPTGRVCVSYKELIAIPAVAEKLRFPQKADRNLGGGKTSGVSFIRCSNMVLNAAWL